MISIHIKILAVLSFFPSVAYLVKILVRVVQQLGVFILFFFFYLVMFTFAFLALDLVFFDSKSKFGDYNGFGGIYGATFMFTLRQAVGNLDFAPFRNLPLPQKLVAFACYTAIIVVVLLIVININVQVIEGCVYEVSSRRLEESYKKKCSVLCELNSVFGRMAKRL